MPAYWLNPSAECRPVPNQCELMRPAVWQPDHTPEWHQLLGPADAECKRSSTGTRRSDCGRAWPSVRDALWVRHMLHSPTCLQKWELQASPLPLQTSPTHPPHFLSNSYFPKGYQRMTKTTHFRSHVRVIPLFSHSGNSAFNWSWLVFNGIVIPGCVQSLQYFAL